MGNKIDVKTIAIDIAFPIMFDNVTVSLVVRWWQRHLPNSVLHVMSFTLRLLFIFIYYYFTEVPKKKKLRKGNFSLISLIETNKYFYQFSRFFQNILQFRAFHCSQWKTRFSSSFRREYLNFHLSKCNEPELARYQSVKCARCSPDVLWAPVKNTESQNYQVLVQRGTASFCTQRSVHGQAIEGIQGAVNMIDYKNFPSVLRSLGCKVFVKHNRINYRTLNKSKHYFRRGTLGGTQDRNTVRKNGKYRNTASKIV